MLVIEGWPWVTLWWQYSGIWDSETIWTIPRPSSLFVLARQWFRSQGQNYVIFRRPRASSGAIPYQVCDISLSLLYHLHIRLDQLSHNLFLTQYVGAIWSSSWKSWSLKAVILQDAYSNIQPLWWQLILFSVLLSHNSITVW